MSNINFNQHRARRDAIVAKFFKSAPSSYIDGNFLHAGTTTFSVIDPALGETFVEVHSADEIMAIEAVEAAQIAGSTWSRSAPRNRSRVLNRAYEIMQERRADLADLITAENGKCTAEALAEIDYASEYFRWYAEEAVRIPSSSSRSPHGEAHMEIVHKPVGVSLLITPWNVPAGMVTRKVAPALAAGCTVVIKPATQTPLVALAIAEILTQAGAPSGVVNVVITSQSSLVVRTMMSHKAVRKISFTGSTQVGRTLLAQASDRVLRSSMELGGNAPLIVLDDADLPAAVDGAFIAKMRNAGMSCVAANRIFVARELYGEFTEMFALKMNSTKYGDGFDPGVNFGPMTDPTERERVHKEVLKWTSSGAQILGGGYMPEGDGYFYPATTVTALSDEDQFSENEIFAPVAAIAPFNDLHELIERLNQGELGLAAYVFGNREIGFVSESLEVGMLGVNRGLVSDVSIPFGGVKQSGIGREGGPQGLLEYLTPKVISSLYARRV
jgi:succinate-semialdehyde dehydrogenase/glutarate-semialdehyde dehydrogenase